MLFLLVALALADIVGVNFTDRQVLNATTTFRRCTFRGCQSSSDGGALYLDQRTASLFLAGCLFENCRGRSSGAVSTYPCLSFSMTETSALNCSSTGFCSFCDVWLSSTANGSLEVRELSAAAGTSGKGTIYFACESYFSGGNTSLLRSVNSSAKFASDGGGGSGLGTTSTSLSASAPSRGTLNAATSFSMLTF
jgi:hypothetical protein